jgi:hypothetical protein
MLASAVAAQASWTTMTIGTQYPTWHQSGYSDTIDDVIYITERVSGTIISPYDTDNSCAGGTTGNRRGFRSQTFANPHILNADNGDWLIQGYGDVFTESTPDACTGVAPAAQSQWVADAIWTITRKTDGSYQIPARSIPDQPTMKFTEGTNPLGYLGAGSGIAKTTSTVSCSGCAAYKYFAIAPVVIPDTGAGWVTWAMSTDGVSWSFLNAAGTGTTSDARSSYHLIHTTSNINAESGSHVWHSAMVYNPADQNFYVNFGYNTAGGIKGTWWRLHFDPSQIGGLNLGSSTFRQILQRGTPSCGTPGAIESTTSDTWVNHNGVLPDPGFGGGWIFDAQSPRTGTTDTSCNTPKTAIGPADAMDLKILYKADGSVDSLLFIYASENAMFSGAPAYYVKGTLPTSATNSADFQWSTPQAFNYSPLDTNKYVSCSSGGGWYLAVTQSGNDATTGNPRLFAYIVTYRKDKYAPAGNCGGQWSGVLPVALNLN